MDNSRPTTGSTVVDLNANRKMRTIPRQCSSTQHFGDDLLTLLQPGLGRGRIDMARLPQTTSKTCPTARLDPCALTTTAPLRNHRDEYLRMAT